MATRLSNRSVPAEIVLPHLVYAGVGRAAAWLSDAFGFVEHYRYGDPQAPSGVQMHLGDAWIMLTEAREGRSSPVQTGAWTQSLTIFVDDVEAHHRQAQSRGAKIVEEPHETAYGEYQYAAEDIEGYHWLFSRHARDVAPGDWGATLAGAE